jgi:hypothetical protein
VTWTVTDIHGNTTTATQLVTVNDVQVPTITAPANVSVNTDAGSCEATAVDLGVPETADNCSGELTVESDAPASFPIGQTTVIWTVTDQSGNTATASQIISVSDIESPAITIAAVTVSADAGSCEAAAVDLGVPETADNCEVDGVENDAPDTFHVGETTVIWTVTDVYGNTSTAAQLVTVTDDEVPTIAAPNNVSVSADAGSCEASNIDLGIPETDDNCAVESVENDAPATFPVGETTVIWTVTDIHGNTATAEQLVTVTDDEAPVISVDAITLYTDEGMCEASTDNLATLTSPVTSDNCAVDMVESDAAATLPVGVNTVTWTVTDIHGNTAKATQEVTVIDNEAPAISIEPVTVSADPGSCEATKVALGDPVATDNCAIDSISNDAPVVFPVGATIVTWTVTDIHGNSATFEQTVTVTDDELPTITAPPADTVTADAGMCEAAGVDLGIPETADNCSVDLVDNDAPASFPVGTTTVTWTVTDATGNTATATQDITVTDNEAPTISIDPITVNTDMFSCEATGVDLGVPVITDNCSADLVENDAAGSFPIGTTTVTWTVTDIYGNTATAAQEVTVLTNPPIYYEETVCSSYTWQENGETYTQSGNYTFVSNCQDYYLSLTVYYPGESFSDTAVCGDIYEWNGVTFDQSGTYTVMLLTEHGCDSTAVLRLALSVPPSTILPTAFATVTQTLVVNECGNRIYRYTAGNVTNANSYRWTLPSTFQGGTVTIDSGYANFSQVILVRFTSNAGAAAGDSLRVRPYNGCSQGALKAYKFANIALTPPLAPSISATTVVSNVCGQRIVRYVASAPKLGTVTTAPSTGYVWTLPVGAIGSTCVLDSGSLTGTEAWAIRVKYLSNGAAGQDTVKAIYTSNCGNSPVGRLAISLPALTPPASPTIVGTVVVSNVCSERIVRYVASAPRAALSSAAASTGYIWTLPTGTLGSTCVLDSGSLTGSDAWAIRVKYVNNAAASLDTVRALYTSDCGNSANGKLAITLAALTTPAPPTITATVVSTACGSRVVRYVASALKPATTNTVAATGYNWTLPVGVIGSTCVLDSGSLSGATAQVIRIRYLSNAAAGQDTVLALYTSDCGNSTPVKSAVTLPALNPPNAPSITATVVVSNICGARIVRYVAAAPVSATSTTGESNGYSWTLPVGVIGSTCVLDSGTLSGSGARAIRIKYLSNAAANLDTVKAFYTSPCGDGVTGRLAVTLAALNPPAAPTITATVVSSACGGRIVRYTASAPKAATTSAPATTGYFWTLPVGNIGTTCVLDSGSLSGANAQVIRIRYLSNAAAGQDTVRVMYNSDCGTSPEAKSAVTLAALNPPAAPTITATVVSIACGARVVRYTGPALAAGTATIAASTGYVWNLPVGNIGSTCVLDSGSLTGADARVIRIRYTSNAAAGLDTVKLLLTTDCGNSPTGRSAVTLTALTPPAAPTVSATVVVANVCGGRIVRYTASAPKAATTTTGASTGYVWTLPTGTLGTTCVLDSGSLTGSNNQVIRIRYISNAAAGQDTVKVVYTSNCGNSPIGRSAVTLTALGVPAAPSGITITLVSDVCYARTYRYAAPNLPAATTTAGAATGWDWTFVGALANAGYTVDSGSLSSQVVRITFYSNDAAATGDSVKLRFVSGCGYSAWKASKLTNVKKNGCPPKLATVPIAKVSTPATAPSSEVDLDATVFPNPILNTFKLKVHSSDKNGLVQVRILDLQGREYRRENMMPEEVITMGSELKSGNYLIQVLQGRKSKVVKVIKL